MKPSTLRSRPAQTCLVSLISVNQLKREFQTFQQQLFNQLNLFQKQSVEDIISIWRVFSQKQDSKKLTHREKNSEESQLQNAFEIINKKQEEICCLQNKLSEAEQSKEELLSILQRQTELCTHMRDQQIDQATIFNRKIHGLEKIIKEKETLASDLKVESTVLKRLLKEEYQVKEQTLNEQKLYSTNPRKEHIEITNSKRLLQTRRSDMGILIQSSNKRNSVSKSKELQPLKSTRSNNFSKTMKINQSTNSIKNQIEKIIQKAVKQNYQKPRR